MADLQDLKDRLDLLAEIEKDLGPGKKSGRWVSFSCPFPGHAHGDRRPSLAVTPDNGHYFCFTCGAKGDLITWLLDYRGLSWRDVLELAGSNNLPPTRPRPTQAAAVAAPSGPPAASWQARGLALADYCERQLWGEAGSRDSFIDDLTPLEYLRRRRGLTDETIKAFHLGYNPKPLNDDPVRWGFDLAAWIADHQGRKHPDKLFIDRGITIPHQAAGALWAVNIRRAAGDPKYRKIAGSQAALFNADWILGAELVLMTEGEFDCILAHQELKDVAGVVTLGSASKHLDLQTWGVYLLPAKVILAALDPDPAGKSGAAALADLSARVHPVRVPALAGGGKDITDYHQAGGDLWEWLKHNLDLMGLLELLGVTPTRVDLAGELLPADLSEVQTV